MVHRLGEIRITSSASSDNHPTSSSCFGLPKQATILSHMQKLSTWHHSQLTKKFQSAHFVVSQGKAFSFYSKLAHFEHTYHGVDLGESYVSDTACAEMSKYFSKSIKIKNITEPLNNGEYHYYSIMNDGSSSAKTMDEKELFLIKTASSGTPKFSIMSLEEVENTDMDGLKVALEKSVN